MRLIASSIVMLAAAFCLGLAGTADSLTLETTTASGTGGFVLLVPFGPGSNRFDPGRMGSYFQTPEDVADSLNATTSQYRSEFATFVDLLERCGVENLGVYVTIRDSFP